MMPALAPESFQGFLNMIDEINYFPKRENYQKKKKPEDDWNELKKKKIRQDSRSKPGKSDPATPNLPPKKE